MNAAAPPGWPFLIARGRRRGYSTLLAPRVLVAERDYGVLEDEVGPADGLPFRVTAVTTARGRPLSLVWTEHAVTTADLVSAAGAAAGAGPAAGLRPVRDEHSRPLRLLYGFACAPATLSGPVEADLARCREAALGTYRRFLADEDGFAVEGSTPFRLASAVPAALPAPAPTPISVPAVAPAAGRGTAVQAAAVALGALVALLAAGVLWLHNSPEGGPPVCPTAPASLAPATTGGPAPASPTRPATRPTGPGNAAATAPPTAPSGPGNAAAGPAPAGTPSCPPGTP